MPSSNEKPPTSNSNYRKSTKPLMEKRRRARINNCLSELKAILLDTMKKDNAQASKMEKADILEMTVRYLRGMQRQRMQNAVQQDPSVINKYRLGFTECAGEVTRYLTSVDGISHELRARMLSHLAHCIESLTTAAAQASHPGHFVPISAKPPGVGAGAPPPMMMQTHSSQHSANTPATLIQPSAIRPGTSSDAAAAAAVIASLKTSAASATGVPSYAMARDLSAAAAAAAAGRPMPSSANGVGYDMPSHPPYSPPIRSISPASCQPRTFSPPSCQPPSSSSTPSPVNLSTSTNNRSPVRVFCPPQAISPVSSSHPMSSPMSSEGSVSPGRSYSSYYSVKAEPLTPPYSSKSISPSHFPSHSPSLSSSPQPEALYNYAVNSHGYPLPPKKSFSVPSDNVADKQSLWRPF